MKKICLFIHNEQIYYQLFLDKLNDFEITCITTIDTISNDKIIHIESTNLEQYFIENKFDLIATFGNYKELNDDILDKNTVINLHHSLLPSFDTKTPIKDAYLYGVKVTGVTIHYVTSDKKNKIITQYPILIDNFMHYDEVEEEIVKLSNQLYPLVIKSVTEGKIFDIVDLLNDNNHTSCNHCKGCH